MKRLLLFSTIILGFTTVAVKADDLSAKQEQKKQLQTKLNDLQSQYDSVTSQKKAINTKKDSILTTTSEMDKINGYINVKTDDTKKELQVLKSKITKVKESKPKSKSLKDLKTSYTKTETKLKKLIPIDTNALSSDIKKQADDMTSKSTNLEKDINDTKQALSSLDSEINKLQDANKAKQDTEAAKNSDEALKKQTDALSDPSTEGLTPHTAEMKKFLGAKFGITSFSLYRPGDSEDHGSGLAIDLMADKAKGDEIVAYLTQNYKALGIKYIIWQQRFYCNLPNIYGPANTWNLMDDRGGDTANHMDHVHISFNY